MISVILVALAWGSYLNSLGYRLLYPKTFFQPRSFCPTCFYQIAWYDNIPLISWIALQGRCRNCKQPISWLYPFIEIITTLIFVMMYIHLPSQNWISHGIFFSTLIVTIRTDFQEMLISRFVTIYLIPFIFLSAYFEFIHITLLQSIVGVIFGYSLMGIIQKTALIATKQEALGQGDVELLAYIGSFIGAFGCWITISIGSLLGVLCTGIYMILTKKKITYIPFGPYLCYGCIIFIFYKNYFISHFFQL